MSFVRSSTKIVRAEEREGEDRISRLPDDLIHHILSFTHTKLAVQTCILSKRWQHIWATLPHLNLYKYNFGSCAKFSLFLTRFFSSRNHQSGISTVNLRSGNNVSLDLLQMIISYAIAHNVQNLRIDTIIPKYCRIPLSIFSHRSLKKLIILDLFRKSPQEEEGLCWCLPALTVLHISSCNLPDSCLNLPALTTLCLGSCTLPKSFSGLPGLTTLHLKHVRIYENKSMYFSELVNLKNLTLEESQVELKVINVSSLQLTNLTIKNSRVGYKFVISAPKLLAFNHSGTLTEYVFPLTSTSLHKVNLEMIRWYFYNWEEYEVAARLIALLQELQNAKFLTINMVIIEALSKVPDLLDQHSSLKNLKFLKVKEDHKFLCSTIPSHVRTYLLSGSPSATIVKEFPKADRIIQKDLERTKAKEN